MKAILMSIRPQYVAKILNGEKTIEIRKKFPKDYVGWVYIYCTKDKKYANLINRGGFLTGMVVARFWCDKVEEIDAYNLDKFAKDSCLTINEIEMYLWSNICCGKAIHITSLEIFDKPKELIEFFGLPKKVNTFEGYGMVCVSLDRPPQSWQYVEVE